MPLSVRTGAGRRARDGRSHHSTPSSATACSTWATTCGAGTSSASSPVRPGPAAVPARNASAPAAAIRRRAPVVDAPASTTIPTPVAAPSATPCSTRPASSHATWSPTAKQTEPSTPATSPARTRRIRPSRSPSGPSRSSAGTLATE
ncbi:hypothetical protein AD006_24765 [Pseudonocardia sp. EC080610-09]|nr:hypothetical protein AD006_24765 [Pseudonocardia sp. EC080610-09]ALL80635.1 hypothetical protein AD017_04355 [Pseudonocardia sp. EC080619-01]